LRNAPGERNREDEEKTRIYFYFFGALDEPHQCLRRRVKFGKGILTNESLDLELEERRRREPLPRMEGKEANADVLERSASSC